MNLVFYGGGDDNDNSELNSECLKLVNKKSPRITYIPSCSYDSEWHFKKFVDHFQKHKVTQFIHFPIDVPFDKILLSEVLKSDLIHLSGGNTYYFLKHLRKSGMAKLLKEFVKRGGVLTGLSAGGIIMTPIITTASFPAWDRDENEEKIKNHKSLDLVSFEFFPHYVNSRRYDQVLVNYSKKSKRPVYATPDGSGIILKEDEITFFGKNYAFYKGKKFILSQHLT
ncbi:MAG: type 1 glutamine amidotransferase-like domain-containing protein [Halobacteriovoraceae bacterium]|nr:type 1 glutamine amidotransferase-like domain-containing protein [Halobacteriovoraceae bacterium]MBT5095677.1 type 1 glutamine amidotransferase-like domain-containing protein [Halobacteriovoraceae bacterium]